MALKIRSFPFAILLHAFFFLYHFVEVLGLDNENFSNFYRLINIEGSKWNGEKKIVQQAARDCCREKISIFWITMDPVERKMFHRF